MSTVPKSLLSPQEYLERERRSETRSEFYRGEVLSETTEKHDRGSKFEIYRQLPSLKEYVLVAQDRPLVERYVRQDDATCVLTEIRDLSQTFAFGAIDVKVSMAEIYRGVTFVDTRAKDQRHINDEEE